MSVAETARQVTMYYDGGCPLCSKEVAHYRRLDAQNRVAWIDIDRDDNALKPLGISRQTAMRRLHVTTRQGTLVTGAYAFQTLWQELPYYRVLARLVSPAPIMKLADRAYTRFAEYRYKKRAVCGDQCRP